jgi:hypothetical protein
VDLLFVVDVSSSMKALVSGGTSSKWDLAKSAVLTFVNDAGSAGLGVALKFFPYRKSCVDTRMGICVGPNNPPGPTPPCPCPAGLTCKTDIEALDPKCVTCDLADYQMLAVPFGPLPAAAPAMEAAFAGQSPTAGGSGTPTWHGVSTGLELLRAQLMANPGRHGALVLVTDGEPDFCTPKLPDGTETAVNDIRPITAVVENARLANPSIATYAVGVFTDADLMIDPRTGMTHAAVVDRVAMAGGTKPFIVNADAALTRQLQETLNQIRNLAVPCDYGIPAPQKGALDYGKVNVHVTTATKEADLLYVRSADRCDPARGGWHYDADPAAGGKPTRVVVCDAACKSLQADPTTRVDLRFGCQTIHE